MSITESTPMPTTLFIRPHPPTWHHRMLPGGGFVSYVANGDTTEIHLGGEIDVHDCGALVDIMTPITLDADVRLVNVAAEKVDFIDLRALRLIGDVRNRLRRSGRELRLSGLHGVYASAWTYATTAAPTSPAVVAC